MVHRMRIGNMQSRRNRIVTAEARPAIGPRGWMRRIALAILLGCTFGIASVAQAQTPEESQPVAPSVDPVEETKDADTPADAATGESSKGTDGDASPRQDGDEASSESDEEPTPEEQAAEDAKDTAHAAAVTDDVFQELSGDAPGVERAPPPQEPTEPVAKEPEVETREDLATQESPDTKPEEEIKEEPPPEPKPVPPTPEPTPEPKPPEPKPGEPPSPAPEKKPAEPPVEPEVPEPAPVDPKARRVWWDDGLRVERNDQLYRIKMGGRLLIDASNIFADSALEDRFGSGSEGDIRQARFDLTGTYGKRTYYRLAVDLTGQSSSEDDIQQYLNNFFVGFVGNRYLGRIEGGIVREPVSMGALTGRLNLAFLERALPDAFLPGFQPGIVVRNEAFERRVTWAFGVFRFRGDSDNGDRMDLTGRITTIPWLSKDGERFIHVGLSYVGMVDNKFDLRFDQRPETWFGDNWVDTGRFEVTSAHVLGAEFAGVWRSIAFQSEFIFNKADRHKDSTVSFWGGYGSISYFLTGQIRHYQRRHGVFGPLPITEPVSFEPFTPGAIELTARYSHLDLDDKDIRGGILNTFTLGVNWYIRHNLRVMANYTHGNLNGVGNGNVLAGRFQVSF
jgi:phosphate-selective porin OprO/OprP